MPPVTRRRVIEAPLEKLQQLQKLQQIRDAQIARKLARIDVFATLGFTPNCKHVHAAREAGVPEAELPPRCGQCPQERFVDLPDADLDVLYGGSGGGGKSHSLLVLALRACVKYPGIQVFWFRRSFPELNQSVLRMLARFGYGRSIGARWNGSRYELHFAGGSVLTFAHAKNVDEASALSSAEINLLILDERTTIPPEVVDFLYTRVRSGVPGVPCLGIRSACVDEGEVLTEHGWRPIQDVKVGDLVQSLDGHGRMSLKPVEWTYAGPADTDMVRVRKRSLYMSMTANHRVVYQPSYKISPVHKIEQWDRLPNKSLEIVRAAASYEADGEFPVPFGWDTDDYLAFLGLFLAEGSTGKDPDNASRWAAGRPSGTFKTIITQCTPGNQPAVKELLERLTMPRHGSIRVLPSDRHNVRWYEHGVRSGRTFDTRAEAEEFLGAVREPLGWCLQANGDFVISRRTIWEHFRQFGKAHDKYVPREILAHAPQAQLRVLLDWLRFGDGSKRPGNSWSYATVSRRLADDVAEIGMKLGYKVQIRHKELPNPNHRDRYVVNLNADRRTTHVDRDPEGRRCDDIEVTPPSGDVYCLKVADHSNFVLRQRGYVWVSGNSNPGFVGHRVVKEGWVDATDYGAREVIDAAGRRRIFIPAKVTDNPFVGDYAETLAGIADPDLRRRILDGDWSVMPDAAFPDWCHDRVVVPAFDVPEGWMRYGGLDYGWTSPSVYLLSARDNDGRVWVYRELVMVQTAEAEQARRILAIEDVVPVVRAADPSMWGKSGSALPPAAQMAVAGCNLAKGDNDRFGGKQRVHSYLAEGPACAHHRALGWDTCPMLHVVGTGCPELVATMESLPRDPKRPEDVDTDARDHAYDACLVAGTLIATRRGDVPIEGVRVGDEVMTRQGWRRVRDVACTGRGRPVLSVQTGSGRVLTGTGEHPVWVEGRGFTRLDALRYHDMLWVWDEAAALSRSSSVASSSVATSTRGTSPTASTTGRARRMLRAAWRAFTERCGNTRTAPSRPGTRSTTRTATPTTTSPTISSASPRSSTESCTPLSRSAMPSVPLVGSTNEPPRPGTPAQKAASGTPTTPAAYGSSANPGNWSAGTAGVASRPVIARSRPGSAPTGAGPMPGRPAGSTTRTESAAAAAAPSAATATRPSEAARDVVRGLSAAGTADVYNLSVEGPEEYFANGILVHNCRYLLMAIGGSRAMAWLSAISTLCPRCRIPSPAGAAQCRACGTPLEAAAAAS